MVGNRPLLRFHHILRNYGMSNMRIFLPQSFILHNFKIAAYAPGKIWGQVLQYNKGYAILAT